MKESLNELIIRSYFGLIVYAQNACGWIKSIINVSQSMNIYLFAPFDNFLGQPCL